MGGGGSKARAQEQINRAQKEAADNERAAAQRAMEQLKEQADKRAQDRIEQERVYKEQMREARQERDRREQELRQEKMEMEKEYKRTAEERQRASHAERIKMEEDHNQRLKEKEEAMEKLRKEDEDRMENIRKQKEQRERQYQQELKEINEKRVQTEREHQDRILAINEKADEVQRVLFEKMITNQKEAFAYGQQMLMAHNDSMGRSFQAMAAIANKIQADKDTAPLEASQAEIRNTAGKIGGTFKAIQESLLEETTSSEIQTRRDKAKEICQTCHEMDTTCTRLINDLCSNQSVPYDIRQKALEAVTAVKQRSTILNNQVMEIRGALMDTPNSVNRDSFKAIHDSIKILQDKVDALPAIQQQSATHMITESIETIHAADSAAFGRIALGSSSAAIPSLENNVGPIIETPATSPLKSIQETFAPNEPIHSTQSNLGSVQSIESSKESCELSSQLSSENSKENNVDHPASPR